ncbi:MAG: osmoprotectant transport system permease protein, partial [Solirubrobacterales bacterium]|nr:osmoprotectant transport system permease protein [Solirubrobacterales bacterium]
MNTLLAAVSQDFFKSNQNTCVAQNKVCPGWAIHHIDRYVTPALQHIVLVVVSVSLGFVIAMALALLSHRSRWLVPPITG